MFNEKTLSLKTFLVSHIITFCYWYENFFSQIFFFPLMKCFFAISVTPFSLKHFCSSQII